MFTLFLDQTASRQVLLGSVVLAVLFAVSMRPLAAPAQDTRFPAADTMITESTPATNAQKTRRSPTRALTYSLGGTLGPLLLRTVSDAAYADMLLVAGIFGGPSLGHFYAENPDQAYRGLITRGVIAGGGLLFTVATMFNPVAIALTGLALAVHATYDIVTAPSSAKEFNAGQRTRAQVAPVMGPGAQQVGLSVRIQL